MFADPGAVIWNGPFDQETDSKTGKKHLEVLITTVWSSVA